MVENDAPLKFLKVAFQDRKVGAVSPSSRHLVKRVLGYVEKDLKVIVEFGSGGGVMTKALLSHLASDGVLFAIEPNEDFIQILSRIPDTRVKVLQGKAEEVMAAWKRHCIPEADLVISSLPFSFLKPKEREALVRLAYARMKKGGTCIIFHQYYPLAHKVLEKVFTKAIVSYEWRNFLPCFVFIAKK